MALATLSIDLKANLATLETDFNKAGRAAEILGQRIAKATGAAVGYGAIATAAAAGALVYADKIAKQVAGFQDLADKSGAAAAAIASFQTASDVSGVSLDKVASTINKLNSTLAKPLDAKTGAGAAIAAIGLTVEQLRAIAPDQQLELIAKALSNFGDGAGKSAAATALLGKSAGDVIPFLNELAESGRSQIVLTAEQIKAADEYSKRQERAKSELQQLAQAAALQALPALNALTETLVATGEQLVGVDRASKALKGSTAVADFASNAAKSLGFIVDAGDGVARVFTGIGLTIGAAAAQVAALKNGDFKIALRIGEELKTDIDALVNRPLFSEGLAARLAAGQVPGKPEAAKPALSFTLPSREGNRGADAAAREAEQIRTAQRDQALKSLDSDLAKQRDTYAFNNQLTQRIYQDSEISLDAYFASRRAAAERDAKAEADNFAARITALKAYRDATQDPSNRVKAQTAVDDAQAEADRAAIERSRDAQFAVLEEVSARKELTARVVEYRAQLKQLEGDEAGAARLRTDAAISAARDFSRQTGGRVSGADVDAEERARKAADALTEAQRRALNATAESRIAESAALLESEKSGLSLIETERRLTAARTAALAVLAETARVAQQVSADAPGDAAKRVAAANATLEYAQAVDQADASLNRMRESAKAAADSIAATIGDSIVNFKGLGSVIASVEKQLLNIGTKVLVTDPLTNGLEGIFKTATEGDNPLGNFFKGALGIGGEATGAASKAAETAAITANVVATTTSTAALTALTAAASSAALSLGASGGASALGSITTASANSGGFFSSAASFFSGFFADGGNIPAGKWGVVGENGPEIAFGGSAGKNIVPMKRAGNGDNYRGGDRVSHNSINVNVAQSPGQSRETASQQGARIGAAIQRSMARNN